MKRLSSLVLIFTFATTLTGYAQTHKAAVRGSISAGSGTLLQNIGIRFVQEETGEVRTAASGLEGEFAISQLPPGPYRLEIEQTGYKKYVERLVLQVAQELRVDVVLEVGSPAQEVLVIAPHAQLKKDSSALGSVIENGRLQGLPLDGRNFIELSLLTPGATPAAPGSAGSVRGEFAFNVNGAREDSNNFLLDGAYNIDPKLNSSGVRPPVDAIREFEILTSTYDASFGRNAGAQVNVITKSGTNRIHGSVYEFFRNGSLDARNFFAPEDESAPQYQRNQFGASVGGALIKNRTFFFADYEGTRVREAITRITRVPTLRERIGDFSESIFARPRDPFSQQPFPGGLIPDNRQNPIGRAIAGLYPEPNRPGPLANFVSSPTQRDRNDHFDLRIDHAFGANSSLAARYSFGDRELFEPFSGPTFSSVPGFGTEVPRRSQNVVISHTQIFSSSLVNEARVAFNRVAASALQQNRGSSINQAIGLPELSSNPRDFGLSFITISGLSPLGDEFNNPQDSVTNLFQILENASYSRGRHLAKFGVDIRAVQQNAFRDVQSRGLLTFSDQPPFSVTGNALADLLLGFPSLSGGARLDNHQHLRTESYNFYAHDSFRLKPTLTISAGLRYEYNSPPVDAQDRANLFDPATGSLVRVGTNGVPRSGYESDKNNLAPRLGLAWTLGDKGETVLRAGYGIYYDQSSLAPGEGLYFNAPFFDFRLFFSLPGLPLTLNDPFPGFFPFQSPQSALAFQRDLRSAYMQHWNFGVQQQLGKNRIIEVAYVGSKGSKLIAARDINQPRPSLQQPVIRPLPQFDDISFLESRANSAYNSLQVSFQQRFESGLSLFSAYTWSRSIDDASNFFLSAGDPNFPQDSFNVSAERGRSNFDVAHRLSLSFSYDLPIGKGRAVLGNEGWLSTLFGGWQTYGIVALQTGRPFTVALLPENDNSNTGRSILGFGANDRPNIAGDPRLSQRTPDRWFNQAAFALPPRGTFGNAGRNILEGPGFQNINIALLKNTALAEGTNLQFRFEAFNLFNHPNFNLPDNFLGSPTFGQILSAQSPRHIQFGLKLLF